jgi:hypothetical protein
MAATLASNDGHCVPNDVDDAKLFQAARDHYYESRTLRRERTEMSSVRRRLLAVVATSGTEQPEFGKWLSTVAEQVQSNIYDIEDEQLLTALSQHQATPIP